MTDDTVSANNGPDNCVWCRVPLPGTAPDEKNRFCSDLCFEAWVKAGGGKVITGDFDEHGEPL